MKSLQCVACAVLILCFLDTVQGKTIDEFISSIPSEIGNAFSTAWRSFVKAIKEPVRIRRLGRMKKRKTTTTTELDPDLYTDEYYDFYTTTTSAPSLARPEIPLLQKPQLKSMLDWRSLQKPSLEEVIKNIREKVRTSTSKIVIELSEAQFDERKVVTKGDDSNHFGVLFFV